MQPLGRHALIIEDEILIALEIEAMLEDLGFESFDIADRPADALAAALAHPPDLITADVRIVGGTGIEAVEAITAAIGATPLVYVTGNRDMVAKLKGVSVVEKPIVPGLFVRACTGVCAARVSETAAGQGRQP